MPLARARLLPMLLGSLAMCGTTSEAASTETDGGRPVVLLDVPFLPQPPELCGGAAAAMVQRYWGAEDLYAEDFQPLVDDELGGITTTRLLAEIRSRGWSALPLRASPELVERQLSLGRPLIALLDGDASILHYVVVVGWTEDEIVIHDPALGPWRVRKSSELFASWKASGYWTLLLLPPPELRGDTSARSDRAARASGPSSTPGPRCVSLVDEAIRLRDSSDVAFQLLSFAEELCPGEALVKRELAALHFRDENWTAAAALAESAVRLNAGDEHAWSLLGASRFLNGDRTGALEAWNHLDEPRIDAVRILGLSRTRQDTLYRRLAVTPGSELTPEVIGRARRRARDLPSVKRARLLFEPLGEGRARVVAHLTEGSVVEPLWPWLARSTVDAILDREARGSLTSPTGSGERLDVEARWWTGREAFRVSLSAPRMMGLPGVATLSGYASRQSYAVSGDVAPTQEERHGAHFELGDWITSSTRATVGFGVDRWRERGDWLMVNASIDRRLFDDRVSLRADGSHGSPLAGAARFGELGGIVLARVEPAHRWTLRGRFEARRVLGEAPLGNWPAAGIGRVGSRLLRGYPLLSGNVVAGEAFAPILLHGSTELERIAWDAGLARLGVAGFFDWAWASGRPRTPSRALSSIGIGGRFHVGDQTLRIDAALRPDDRRLVLSAGWVESW